MSIFKDIVKFFTVFFLLTNASRIFAQNQNWYEIQGAPYLTNISDRLEYVNFINQNTGWALHSVSGKIYRTTNSGLNWGEIFTSTVIHAYRSIAFFDSLTGFLGTTLDTPRALYRTTNGGFNWILITEFNGLKPMGMCGLFKVNDSVMYGSGWYENNARVIKTTNIGATWQTFDLSALAKGLTDCYFFNQDSGFAVGWKGTTYGGDARGVVLFTANGGANWTTMYTTTNQGQNCWKISFPSRNIGYVSLEKFGNSAYFLKTTNSGATWEEKLFLNRNYVMQGIGFVNENTGWIGGSRNSTLYSYKTTNGGDSWDSVGVLKNVNKFIFLNDTMAFAVGRTIYRFGTNTVNIQQVNSIVPSKFKLYQNYPNPFNPKTNFDFLIKSTGNKSSEVSLNIYDITGKLISTLFKGNLKPGKYNITFDGSNLNSGIYFYSLQAGDFKETLKMVLLK